MDRVALTQLKLSNETEKLGRWIASSKSGSIPDTVKGGDLDIYIQTPEPIKWEGICVNCRWYQNAKTQQPLQREELKQPVHSETLC